MPFQEKTIEVTILTNYDFIVEEEPLTSEQIKDAVVKIMKASEILKILEEQNKIF